MKLPFQKIMVIVYAMALISLMAVASRGANNNSSPASITAAKR